MSPMVSVRSEGNCLVLLVYWAVHLLNVNRQPNSTAASESLHKSVGAHGSQPNRHQEEQAAERESDSRIPFAAGRLVLDNAD